jgi:hypothetical protein
VTDQPNRPAELNDVAVCYPNSYRRLTLGGCVDRWAADAGNLEIEGKRSACYRCPWGRERRAAYAEARPVNDPRGGVR